ncbi:hypothetical protein ACFQFH_05705 [Halobaculum halobium]|uniref:hypothetical protein n=1 Tax=Halobaculum halobium TaxID=3032281 RepID=UPI00360C3B6B
MALVPIEELGELPLLNPCRPTEERAALAAVTDELTRRGVDVVLGPAVLARDPRNSVGTETATARRRCLDHASSPPSRSSQFEQVNTPGEISRTFRRFPQPRQMSERG